MKTNNRYLLIILSMICMFSLGFTLVPLYNAANKTLDLKKLDAQHAAQTIAFNKTRIITVNFLATTNANLPWDFYPQTKTVAIHPGENITVNYIAKNDSLNTMTVQATPNVTPNSATQYLKKIEGFGSNPQTLKAGERREMPMSFRLDPDLPKNINTVTLAYTMLETNKTPEDTIRN